MKRIYLDYNATTPLAPRVLDAMLPYMRGCFGNPSSMHEEGLAARQAVEQARERVARCFAARTSEISFTGGGTEGNNLVISSVATAGGRPHVITTAIEHSSVLATCRALAAREVLDLTVVSVDSDGRVSTSAIARAIRPTTALISVMAANNETGALQPVRAVGEIARAHGVGFHCDATQVCGKAAVTPSAWFADFVTCSAHKFYGPKGVGVLYVRTGAALAPTLFGGHQEAGVRPGTENVAGIVGLAEALDLSQQPEEWDRLRELRDQLEARVRSKVSDVVVNTSADHCVCNTLNVSFLGVNAESLLLALDLRGVSVSSGAACHTATREPSHVLLAMGRSAATARSAVRFSLGHDTTQQDLDTAVSHVATCVARLRAAAPVADDLSVRAAPAAAAG